MLLLVEGFEGYGTTLGSSPEPTGIINRSYDSVVYEGSMRLSTGRLGGYCIRYASSNCQMKASFNTTHDTIIVSVAVKFSVISDPYFLILFDGVSGGMSLRTTNAGEIVVYRAATILGTSAVVFVPNTWYYVEFKVKTHETLGTYEVRVGGVNVLSDSGIDTQPFSNPYHDGVQLDFSSGTGSAYFDDWCVCDGSGSINNDFTGNCRVDAIFPDGDDTAGWAIASGGGNHYLDVNENPADDDASYVEDSVTGSKDLYDYAAISIIPGAIRGLSIKTICRETDAQSFDFITPIKSGATESDNSAQSIGTTDYTVKKRISELDPNTAAAWTKTTLDAAKFGVKVG